MNRSDLPGAPVTMHRIFKMAACVGAAAVPVPALARPAELRLTTEVPACQPPNGRALPSAYYARPRRGKPLRWPAAVARGQAAAGGEGWKRYENPGIRDWFEFTRTDLNNDGICDRFVTTSVPDSRAGDHDTLNTLYLGRSTGWQRIGAPVAPGDMDALGSGRSETAQQRFLFGEGMATIYDAAARVSYFVTSFNDRDVEQSVHPGDRIVTWDVRGQTLRLLDKWKPGSPGAQVSAFFKAHGAHSSDQADASGLPTFDPTVERLELAERCRPRTSGNGDASPPPELVKICPDQETAP